MPRIKAQTVVGGSRNIIRLQIELKIGPFSSCYRFEDKVYRKKNVILFLDFY